MLWIASIPRSKRSIQALLCGCAIAFLAPGSIHAQLFTFSKQELMDYTAQEPFDRLPDGRPKVPNDMMDRARELSSEEIWAILQQRGFNNQYADGFQVLQPGKTLVGRAFTVQFMPSRSDVDEIARAKAKNSGLPRLTNQTAIDMLQAGDVLVVDLFGKKVNGTIVGDNLFYYVMKATGGVASSWTAALETSMEFQKSTCRHTSAPSIPHPSETSCSLASTFPYESAALPSCPAILSSAIARASTSFRHSL